MLKKAKETPLQLGGNVLKVSLAVEPTHDQSILLVNNLNPKTSKETLKDFIEATKNADVFQVIFGKHRKAIVILKNEIGECTLGVVFTIMYVSFLRLDFCLSIFRADFQPRLIIHSEISSWSSEILKCLIETVKHILIFNRKNCFKFRRRLFRFKKRRVGRICCFPGICSTDQSDTYQQYTTRNKL